MNKIIITGGAGFVGKNLLCNFRDDQLATLYIIDKSLKDLQLLKIKYPKLNLIFADLSEEGSWQDTFSGADAVIMLQAKINGKKFQDLLTDNVRTTELVLSSMKRFSISRLIHVSSSVINSQVNDFYSSSKKLQEDLVLKSNLNYVVLRPTLMFGPWDNKHLGWLAKFLKFSPIFPVASDGSYYRQPLYVKDFCLILNSCLANSNIEGIYDITGLEKIKFIILIKKIRKLIRSRSLIVHISLRQFNFLLRLWMIISKNPIFTPQQLHALIAPDNFRIIPWQTIFGVKSTELMEALEKTFKK
jgi:nucleoside-diphosphate-sugar epimerase